MYKLRPSLFLSKKKNPKEVISEKRMILFSDLAAGDGEIPDCLNRRGVANEIAKTIDESNGQMNFLVSGEWGIGKSSILKFIEQDLIKLGAECIWFSPWKYTSTVQSSNAISRAFLTCVADSFGKNYLIKDLYIKKKTETEKNIISRLLTLIQVVLVYSVYVFILFVVLSFIGPILIKYTPMLSEVVSKIGDKNAIAIAAAILALPSIGQYFYGKIKEQGEIDQINSPELFEDKFKLLVSQALKNRRLQKLLSFWEEGVSGSLVGFLGEPLTKYIYRHNSLTVGKIVIFVDDLDRCNKEEIPEFLTAMKTFFESKQVYYVLAADTGKLSDVNNNEPEFLRKIIQLDWKVPMLNMEEVKIYAEKLLTDSGALEKFSKPELDQIYSILSLQPNPRKIKYYLRRLLFEMNLEQGGIYER